MDDLHQIYSKNKRIRRKKRSSGKYSLRRRKLSKNPKNFKLEQCISIIQKKQCEVCRIKDMDDDIILCDECDDAYHYTCLNIESIADLKDMWLCPNCCEMQEEQIQESNQNLQVIEQVCFSCNGGSEQEKKSIKYRCGQEQRELHISNANFIRCLSCKHDYHTHCFSFRKNSLCCQTCESSIRKEGPKGHFEFIEFLKKERKIIQDKGFVELDRKKNQNGQQKRTYQLGLKIFEQCTDWQKIIRYEASLYYSLKARKLVFCDEQIYSSVQVMEMNNSRKQNTKVLPLHLTDQNTYELYKAKIKKGAVGPYEIKEDRVKGFYVVSTSSIQKGTIICQYTGEVWSHRASLNEDKNDSIFILLLTGSSKEDLNIIPKTFGNMSRFICGVNNHDMNQLRKVNITSVRFSHHGRMRIIFVAKKLIKQGDTLYLDYNAGTYEEYPTDNFVQ